MFKKTLIVIGILSALIFSPVSVFAEKIDTYAVHIKIGESGDLSLVERIAYDFGTVLKHDIYRNIPLEKEGNILNIQDMYASVDNFIIETNINTGSNKLLIKLPRPIESISAIHNYGISYKIKRPFIYNNEKENVSLNVFDTDWGVKIDNASFLVELPFPLSKSEFTINCISSLTLSNNVCGEIKFSYNKHGLISAFFVDSIQLAPSEGITLELSIPKSSLTTPPLIDTWINFIKIFWAPLIAGILGTILLIVWYKKRRDIKGIGVIVPQYEVPEKMHPLMIAAIIKEGRLSKKDFVASVIHLAHLGFISIQVKEGKKILNVKTEKDIYILRLEKTYDTAEMFDKYLLNNLFLEGNKMPGDTVILSSLNLSSFWKELHSKIKNTLIQEGYYTHSIHRFNLDYHFKISKSINVFLVLTIVLVILVNILDFTRVSLVFNPLVIIGSLISIFVMYGIFIYTYPSKTKKGALIQEKIKGFKMYLSIAEKDISYFENPPEVTTKKFSEYLSYASILGVENAWSKACNTNQICIPTWWQGSRNFTSISIVSDMVESINLTSGFSTSSRGGGSW